MADITFTIEYAKSSRSTCKASKEKIPQGEIRLAKITPSPFNEGEFMSQWFLPRPFFDMMRKMRKTSKKVETVDDLSGFDDLGDEDKEKIRTMVRDFWDTTVTVTKAPPKKKAAKKRAADEEDDGSDGDGEEGEKKTKGKAKKEEPKKASKKPKKEPHASEVVPLVDVATDAKAICADLLPRARADGIKIPTDDGVAKSAVGGVILSLMNRAEQNVDLGLILDDLEKNFGTSKYDTPLDCACEANRGLAMCFKELSSYEFKAQDKYAGMASNKACKAICAYEHPIASGKQVSAGKDKLAGVGKGSGDKIDQFLETGTFEKLEEWRSSGGGI